MMRIRLFLRMNDEGIRIMQMSVNSILLKYQTKSSTVATQLPFHFNIACFLL